MVKKIRRRRKPKTAYIFDYHSLAFQTLHTILGDKIQSALIEDPSRTMRDFWSEPSTDTPIASDLAWPRLQAYLSVLESKIAAIAATHSIYYWVHLYRRIGVTLSRRHRGKSDQVTVALVRQVMEAAFVRYGRIIGNDIARTSSISSIDILGGWFERVVLSQPDRLPVSPDEVIRRVMKSDQWVLADFREVDLVNVYALEGLAYEYWMTLATMRSVGKGAKLALVGGESPRAVASAKLVPLLESYDRRTTGHPLSTSLAGAGFFPDVERSNLLALVPRYNFERQRADEQPALERFALKSTTNFVYEVLDLGAFAASHAFLNDAFRAFHGFGVDDLCDYLYAVLLRATSPFSAKGNGKVGEIVSLYQRAYEVVPMWEREFDEEVLAWGSFSRERKSKLHDITREIREFLTLRESARNKTSLWTGGPRYLFVPIGNDGCLVDYQALVPILNTLFVRLKHDQEAKGMTFEDGLRTWLDGQEFEILPERELKAFDGKVREADVAVRVGDVLFLCECRAMERPLDYELGRIKTIERRSKDFASKVSQVRSLLEFVMTNPAGANYNFKWASRIVPLVVSPFVEWIWTSDTDCWLDSDTPIVLSPVEAVELFRDSERHANLGVQRTPDSE